ncbi:putative acetylornithine deacetylase [Phaeomoniella chlamydospora]|uniref:Putative acetylornithine deacetylase n=1 Tax=Phaeomoniella chlamydospora TaxID=158046 RepID=A0A0G2EB87_PHACM|nr:putative acetylornithine deacetylase [Phaeomoniella chlamydospora]
MTIRRAIYHNPLAESWTAPIKEEKAAATKFHEQLPSYAQTQLVSLDYVAHEIGVKSVLLKDESSRLGLPSFKILGASWGTFCAVTQKLHLPFDTTLDQVQATLSRCPITLFAATDGNHGRAVARMGKILGVPVSIFVPATMHVRTKNFIREEGAEIVECHSSYDMAVQTAFSEAEKVGGILVQDTAFDGYTDIPSWIVNGYRTMFREIDAQIGDRTVDLVIAPVGVGSFAQAVALHYKSPGRSTKVLTVEPDTAACLWMSLKKGENTPIETEHTIMAGLDCGTVSSIAWPILRDGVDASITISDLESHQASQDLAQHSISAGPCGSAPLAALRKLRKEDLESLQLTDKSTVVLLCTEGAREYEFPRDVSSAIPHCQQEP